MLFTAFVAVGQDVRNALDIINKGDEAMKNLDYNSALFFYEEVVFSHCNVDVIRKLTNIWFVDESSRTDMANVMKRCFTCLDNNATKLSDTASINLLIIYYMQGIGTNKNEAMAESWKQRLEEIQNPHIYSTGNNVRKPQFPKEKMKFFAGYSASLIAPAGFTVGGVGRTVGWYVRLRSNLSFQGYTEEYDNAGKTIVGFNDGFAQQTEIRKTNTLIGTGGIMIKAAPSLYLSAGVGYSSRELLFQFKKIGAIEADPKGDFWAKCNSETSFKGVALDLDGTVGIGKRFYGSVGLSVLDFRYLYANAGVGVFF